MDIKFKSKQNRLNTSLYIISRDNFRIKSKLFKHNTYEKYLCFKAKGLMGGRLNV